MACVIAAPNSDSGKTILSLILSAWAVDRGLSIQTFKIGPDYLDPQQLSQISRIPCRNLDTVLCGHNWVQDCFTFFSQSTDFSLVEGVMGLYDGIGPTQQGSTAEVARILKLPVVLLVDGSKQASSIAALVNGFINYDRKIKFAGVVLNRVSSKRHKKLLVEVLENMNIKVLGCLPVLNQLTLPYRHLGLAPAHEQPLELRRNEWSNFAESYLDIQSFRSLLSSPCFHKTSIKPLFQVSNNEDYSCSKFNIAIANDQAFHFLYPETKEFLESLGMVLFDWSPLEDKPLPNGMNGLIIPGGFPEQYSAELSSNKRALSSIKNAIGRIPIYAECGGMLLFGNSLQDLNGNLHPMAGVLPFQAKKSSLSIGYRKLKGIQDSLLIKKQESYTGHEFHRWNLTPICENIERNLVSTVNNKNFYFTNPWTSSGWAIDHKKEGWATNLFHASWIHLHWPSNPKIALRWRNAISLHSN